MVYSIVDNHDCDHLQSLTCEGTHLTHTYIFSSAWLSILVPLSYLSNVVDRCSVPHAYRYYDFS